MRDRENQAVGSLVVGTKPMTPLLAMTVTLDGSLRAQRSNLVRCWPGTKCQVRTTSDDRPPLESPANWASESAGALMCNQTGFGTLVAIIGFAFLIDPGVAYAQIEEIPNP